MQKIRAAFVFLWLSIVLGVSFQNCGKFDAENYDGSFELSSECVTGAEGCTPEDSVKISVNSNPQVILRKNENVPFKVELGPRALLDPSKSYLQVIAGECPANRTWALAGRQISPWTIDTKVGGENFKSGINLMTYDSRLATDMDGCTWRGCLETTGGMRACLLLLTESTVQCQPGTTSTTQCTPVANAQVKKVCDAFGKWGPCQISCNSGYSLTLANTCAQSSCDIAAKPARVSQQFSCTTFYGPTYTGNYTATTDYICQGTQWLQQNTNDANTACTGRRCDPNIKPANVVQTLNCAIKSSSLTGTFRRTTPYICNTMNWSWTPGAPIDDTTTCVASGSPTTTTMRPPVPTTTMVPPIPTTTTRPPTPTTLPPVPPPTTTTTTTTLPPFDPNKADIEAGRFNLYWSYNGRPSDRPYCWQINEPSDLDGWDNNFLCSDKDLKITWSFMGRGPGNCWPIVEAVDPHSWSDNYICSPYLLPIQYSSAGGINGKKCVRFYEPQDPNTWFDNYLCWPGTGSEVYDNTGMLSSLIPDSNGDVTVPAGETYTIDESIDVNTLRISPGATLKCSSNADDVEIRAKTIYVTGTLRCGSEGQPYPGKLTISLKHNSAIEPKTGIQLGGSPDNPRAVEYRAILVNSGGRLLLYGKNPGSFVRLASEAMFGSTSIKVDRGVPWEIDDKIAIAPTTFEPFQGEAFNVRGISGTTVQLKAARSADLSHLTSIFYRHYGAASVESYSTQRGTVTLDQRAEVVNLSRNIKIQAYDPYNTLQFHQANQLGGHVMVTGGGFAQIDGVEFYKMGQAGIMGRYPFHWHFVGNAQGSGAQQYIKNSSIHDSFQRCITVHQTNNAIVEGNSCYRFRGHGYFLEDGNETGNVLRGNIGIGAFPPYPSDILLQSDNPDRGVPNRFPSVSVFWITHPTNTVTGNIAAGCAGTGLWNSFEWAVAKDPTTQFSDNVAHSCLVGITWDGARGTDDANNLNNKCDPNDATKICDRFVDIVHYGPPNVPTFNNLTAYKNQQAGIYFRGDSAIFENAVLADNGMSFFVAYNQILKNSLIVGRSSGNNSSFEDSWVVSRPQLGVMFYDGPAEYDTVDFINFGDRRTPFGTGGGSEKVTNYLRRLRFDPVPAVKLKIDPYTAGGLSDMHYGQSIRDLDGTFTGINNSLIMGDGPFTTPGKCSSHSAIVGGIVCRETEAGVIRVYLEEPLSATLPQNFTRNDGVSLLTAGQIDEIRDKGDLYYTKTTLITTENYSYDLNFFSSFDRNRLRLQWYSENDNSVLSPVIRIKDFGANCRLYVENSGGPADPEAVNARSRAGIESATYSAYYSEGNDLLVRLRAENYFGPLTAPRMGRSGDAQVKTVTYRASCP